MFKIKIKTKVKAPYHNTKFGYGETIYTIRFAMVGKNGINYYKVFTEEELDKNDSRGFWSEEDLDERFSGGYWEKIKS